MKIIYFGTPEFAVKPLEKLYQDEKIEILAVVTQPDKPQGRKQTLTASPVKICAEKLGLKIIQPKRKRELRVELEKFKAIDFLIVIAYGMILPNKVLKISKLGAINIHPSLLPKYRGATPIQEAILHGDEETGVSIMSLDREMDHGDIYLMKRVTINENENLEQLTAKLSNVAAEILPHTLGDISTGALSPIKQNHQNASYCHKITKEDGEIDFQKSAKEIQNMLKAFTPWPGIHTCFNGKKLKIIEMEISAEQIDLGKFVIDGKILKIGTKDGTLIPKKLQMEGKNIMEVAAFINGYRTIINK